MHKIAIHVVNPIDQIHLNRFRKILREGPVLITTHANPDPDALASGKAISHLLKTKWGIPTKLIYIGLVGRAENRAILKMLTPEWEHADQIEDLSGFLWIANLVQETWFKLPKTYQRL